ncbi:MAG: HPr family phosphocarrier protein [Lachnospiraceae bacterium]|nr:HPr family phosphocarrier protein [Lachnospiraceae bacterium]
MFTKKIRLRTVDDVREFVKAADKRSFRVDIQNGLTLIDAKSIMGVMSLDLTQNLTVVYEKADPELEQVLKKFES